MVKALLAVPELKLIRVSNPKKDLISHFQGRSSA